MKLKFVRIFALLLMVCILGSTFVACNDATTTKPAKDSGVKRACTKDDLIVEKDSWTNKSTLNDEKTYIISIEFGLKVKGKEDYAYVGCAVEATWTYEQMNKDGLYETQTYTHTFNLNSNGDGSFSETITVDVLATKEFTPDFKVISGTVTPK